MSSNDRNRRTRSAPRALVVFALVAAAVRADGDAELAALLAPGLERGYPGVAALVESRDGAIRSAAVGESDLERRVALRPEDGFQIASITKLFTATATLRLVDQGKLSLDAKLGDLLGAAAGKIPHAAEITLAQLLDHSSGIYPTNNDPDYIATVIGAKTDPRRVWSPEELVALADGARQKPVAEPGSGHHYSDSNYTLLGMIVAKTAGRPFKEHVAATLFEPLGMRATWFYSDALAEGATPRGATIHGYLLASADLRAAIAIHPMFRAVAGRGAPDAPLLDTTLAAERIDAVAGIVTTLPDLASFGSALFRGRLLSERSQALLTSVAAGLGSEKPGTARVWIAQAIRQPWGVVLYKEGDSPGGMNTLLAFDPASGTLFAGFVNHFGRFDEVDFLFETFGKLLASAPHP